MVVFQEIQQSGQKDDDTYGDCRYNDCGNHLRQFGLPSTGKYGPYLTGEKQPDYCSQYPQYQSACQNIYP